MNHHAPTYNVGDRIAYVAFGGQRRIVIVTAKHDDVKNGRPGFDGHLANDQNNTVWGYDDQIVATLTRPDGI